MKLNRAYGLLSGAIVASAILFTGCKSGAVKPPATQPVTKEAPNTSVPPVVTMANTSDAKVFLQQAAENSFSAKSVSFEIQINAEAMGMSFPVALEVTKYDNLTHFSSEFRSRRVECYSDDKNMVILEPMRRKWILMLPEERDMILSLLEQFRRKTYIEHVNNASFSNDEKIQDKNYQVIEATIKLEAANEILATQNNPMMQGRSVKIEKSALKVWIEKDTGLIYKSILNVESTMTGDIPGLGGQEGGMDIEDEEKAPESKPEEPKPEGPKTTKIKYEIEINNSDYNKVAPIVIPDEVKKLLETPVIIDPANK